jgi:hypothetical protein
MAYCEKMMNKQKIYMSLKSQMDTLCVLEDEIKRLKNENRTTEALKLAKILESLSKETFNMYKVLKND